MQGADRADRVAQVFQRQIGFAQPLSFGPVPGLDRRQHRHRSTGRHADGTRGETAQAELAQVHNGRPFTNAADHQLWVDMIEQTLQVFVLGRIGTHGAIFHGTDQPLAHQPAGRFRRDVVLGLDIEDDRLAHGDGCAAQAGFNPFGRGRERHRQRHCRGHLRPAQDFGLVDQLAVIGAEGRDQPGIRPDRLDQEIEHFGIFAD